MNKIVKCAALFLSACLVIGIIYSKIEREVVYNSEKNTNIDSTDFLIPSLRESNIDAVLYDTLFSEKEKNHVTTHVVVEGPEEKIPEFVLPYSTYIIDLNPGVSDVTIKIYKSKENFDSKEISWLFEDGKFYTL
ncbi:hypothetical protein NDS46_30705 (plasmid) [Paenibacillus thiaminolyticus]|uniref:hypothetical protein n=1 Tax=Paenibacillus thiaminolyticus TaxID=49283 RepID=UPI00232D3311|nr:hypothetical protein [Paenibacillus thiaminolyticus]WCF11717.1 hypothetical protein NDS46_30705 [Paenibacillus thiaminolyticus]